MVASRVVPTDLTALARIGEAAADAARAEVIPRFRRVAVEHKADGSSVTEADRAAERAIRAVLRERDPDAAMLGEEYGCEGDPERGPAWVIDPIDGTIAFSRGIPLFSTLLARLEDGEPVLGLIDLPMLGERTVGWRSGGVRRGGVPVRVSEQADLARALVAHGDVYCFDAAGERAAFERMVREIPMLRGYTDAFGHALVVGGAVDAMVDLELNAWDIAATRVLVPEAGGRCEQVPSRTGKTGLVFGAPALVDALLAMLETPGR